MILYHGTDCKFKKPLLRKCLAYKDFGKGFYLTECLQMARDWGRKKNSTNYAVNLYTLEDDWAEQMERVGLKVKQFSADAEWAEFVYTNREVEHYAHSYDVVIGPVADNRIAEHFAKIKRGEATFEEIAQTLPYHVFGSARQICFCTEESLTLLKYKERYAHTK